MCSGHVVADAQKRVFTWAQGVGMQTNALIFRTSEDR